MKPVEAYQTSDGQLFTNESEAVKRQDDIIGEELDGFLMMYELDITRNQEFKAVHQGRRGQGPGGLLHRAVLANGIPAGCLSIVVVRYLALDQR